MLIILLLIGAALIVVSENKKNSYRLKITGIVIWIVGFVITLPFIYYNTIQDIKKQGIIEYLNGEIEVIQHSDSTYTFLWIDTN